jgi:Ca2+-binding RTX toxin-like protein
MQFEQLEPRLLLMSASLIDGLLRVEASAGRDRIRVVVWQLDSGDTIRVVVNGRRQPLIDPPPQGSLVVGQIAVNAGRGNDSVTLEVPLGVIPNTVHGGSGDDEIRIVARGAEVFGGKGDDVIMIAPNDLDPRGIAFGGDGNDLITTGDSGRELHGGNGNDTLIGGKGADQLFGDAGNDALKGREGMDTYFGGDGNDRFYSSDANREPLDAGNGSDRAFFPDDCSLPLEDFQSIERVLLLGTHLHYFCWI